MHESRGPHGKAGALNDGWRRVCTDADLAVSRSDGWHPEASIR